jgi:hypothetical protein
MEKKPTIIQPNAVTNARYDYSQMQKDFMFHYIEAMNKHMTKEKQLRSDLFGNIVIEIDLKDICKANNHGKMLAAIKDLQKKPISYYYNRDDGTYDVTTTLIASVIHKRNSGRVTIKTTEESLPVLMWLGEGFTTFNKNIALSLPSVYAKRLYEICCRWKDRGFCRMPINEFRVMMSVEDKYEKISDLRANVLDISERFLKEQADLYFTYQFRKENGSKSFNWLELNIINQMSAEGKESVQYQKLYNILYVIYRNSRAFEICEFIATHKELKRAAERFLRLNKDIDTGKIRTHGILAYVNAVLANEFEVPDKITGRGLEKLKRQRKGEKALAAMKTKQTTAAQTQEKAKKHFDQGTAMQNLFNENVTKKRTGDAQSIKDILKELS